MKKTLSVLSCILAIFVPLLFAQAVSSEIHVAQNGGASFANAKVMQIAGNTFFARLYWGDAFIRVTIKTNSTTQFTRATGEKTTISEIREGDLVDATGELESGSNTLNLVAASVKNASLQKEHTDFSGNVAKIDSSARQFTLYSRERGPITVQVGDSTTFRKGSRTVTLGHLRPGDVITTVSGDYNIATKMLAADDVTIYVDINLFKPRLFIGKLVNIPSDARAASMSVMIDNTSYTIALDSTTRILRKNWSPVTLPRFVSGDTIRIWGTLREVDEPIIDAEVVRNMNL